MSGLPSQLLTTDDIEILTAPDARLEDTIINACSVLLKLSIPFPDRAKTLIFPCYEITRIREGASPNYLWDRFCEIRRQV